MTTDLETDLRREFDAARPPSTLTFSPDSVLRQGSRTIRRHRIIAAGSAAVAVVLVATGASLMTHPHNSAVPLPATHTATTGIVKDQVSFTSGTFSVQINRDPRVESNVKYSVVTPDGKRHEVGGSSTHKPGAKPVDTTWGSGIVDGHPVTIGLVPDYARNLRITFADGGSSYGWGGGKGLEGTGYAMFAVDYPATARPTQITSIRWTAPTGIVDGIEGEHRLTGRVLALSKTVSVEVVLRPLDGGRTSVFGTTNLTMDDSSAQYLGLTGGFSYGSDLIPVTSDPSGVAVATGRTPLPPKKALPKGKEAVPGSDGAPVAAGILPPGASNIGVMLTTNRAVWPLPVSERLPDGRVIFALQITNTQPCVALACGPRTDSVMAVTWTNADGTQGRKDVTQKQQR